jgi:hypothetical protein
VRTGSRPNDPHGSRRRRARAAISTGGRASYRNWHARHRGAPGSGERNCSERLCCGLGRRPILMGGNFRVYVGNNALEVTSVRFGHVDSIAYEARAFPNIDQGALHAGPNLAKFC